MPISSNYIFRRGPWVDGLFWLLYGGFWHLIFAPEPLDIGNLLFSVIFTGFQVMGSYVHLRLLLRRRWSERMSVAVYAGLTLLLVLGSAVACLLSLAAFMNAVGATSLAREMLGTGDYGWLGNTLGGMGTAVALTGAIAVAGHRREQLERERQLETAKTEAELTYLRGQLNPHFLFNALNSIYVLIRRDPEGAAEALAGFSDLLRYQLYRSEEELVPLQEEVAQLRQFVELSRLRLEEDFSFSLRVPDQLRGNLPPMLLLPLVENAIKYSPQTGAEVVGELTVAGGRLHFALTNRISALQPALLDGNDAPVREGKSIAREGGIGLENIRRRLDLLHPGDYKLAAHTEEDRYSIHLELPLAP